MIRLYIMPLDTTTAPGSRGPKYLRWGKAETGIACPWSLMDYGLIPACMIAADVTQAQHDELTAYNDVAAAPLDIDRAISAAALPKVQAVLEALRIPAGWVTTAYTYRDVLRMFGGLCQFAQRYHAMHNESLIDSQSALGLRWNQIPLARQQRIRATADALGYDYSTVAGRWLVRRILKHLADQWADTPLKLGLMTL